MLNVAADAKRRQVKRAFRDIALLLHPDKTRASGDDPRTRAFLRAQRAQDALLGDSSGEGEMTAATSPTWETTLENTNFWSYAADFHHGASAHRAYASWAAADWMFEWHERQYRSHRYGAHSW